jgi:hypothetical protein
VDAQLAAQFRSSISDYVSRLEAVQSELFALYRRKRTALATADVGVLQSLLEPEADLAKRLTTLRNERQQSLARAGQFGAPHGSLAELVTALGGDEELQSRIARCRSRSTELRREGWVHWVVAQRSIAQTSSLLDLIAHRGDRPPTYDGATTTGGTLLDTSA